MRIREAMTRQVRTVTPSSTIREAALAMAELDVGALPVSEGDRLVGMITDRDIAIRAVAAGKSAESTVSECMSPEVKYCFEDESIEEVAENMADIQVRRLPPEWREALKEARERAVETPVSRYLMGIPMLGDFIEAGADALGIELLSEEEDGLGDPDIDTRGN